MSDIEKFLRQNGIKVTEDLIKKFEELGIDNPDDLQYLKEEDLINSGLLPIQQRKLLSICQPQLSASNSTWSLHSASTVSAGDYSACFVPPFGIHPHHHVQFFSPPPSHMHPAVIQPSDLKQPYNQHLQPHPPKRAGFKIRYVMCTELFTSNQEEWSLINLQPEEDTMEHLIRLICDTQNLSESLTVELFGEGGHPLNINIFTMKMTLAQWNIENDDAFYAFICRKEQPYWNLEELSENLPDPRQGRDTLKILSQVFGTFTINLDLHTAKVDTVIKKAAQCISVPLKYLELFLRIDSYRPLKDTEISNIHSGDTLILRLKPSHNLLQNYGRESYIPLQEQTTKGIAKFYCILRFLAGDANINHRAIVATIMKHTECPPLATALHHVLHFKSFSHLSYLVALFEGFYYFSKAILMYFCNVELNQTLEFSDYIFGLVLKHAETVKNDDLLSFKTISLQCPITNRKIIKPVILQNKCTYEESAVKQLIADNKAIPECDAVDITEADLFPDRQLEAYLISCAFSPVPEVLVLERKYQAEKLRIPPISLPCTWTELAESVARLEVTSPGNDFTSKNVLTYMSDGQFAVFTDINKGTELTRVLYNPVTCKDETYTLEQMKEFVCFDKKKVTHNLADFLNPKVKGRLSKDALAVTSVVILEKKDVAEITREPKEAIMVLLDTSESMDSFIFDDQEKGYKRIRAAQDFFAAFANRTQAYELHHVIGVICFNTEIKVALPLCEVMSEFKSVLESTATRTYGMTALYDALKEATEILSKFGTKHPLCQKRILCLSDGEDNKSKTTAFEVAKLLQSKEIIVDTVLITGPKGYPVQKAISHSTGGFCFLPKSRTEGMRLFEMEVLLSILQRDRVSLPTLTTEDNFKKLQTSEYDSTDPFSFQCQYFLGLDKTTTCSARRMVLLASFVSNEHSPSSGQKPHVKHILQEMKKYIKNPHEHIEIFPNEDNVCNWKILLRGPDGTPYEKGIYLLFAKFPENYPYKAPEIRFVTPIYHCNINSMGRICHPILGRNYIPCLSIRDIFDQIYGLMMAPEADDPLDSVLADEYHTHKDEYMRKARDLNRQKACGISWEDYKKTLTEATADVAEELLCPLTNQIFVDPVTTPYGHTYEKHAILDYMKCNNNLDPKAKRPIRPEDLRPQRELKAIAENFRKANLL